MALLEVNGVSKNFGGLRVINNVTLGVEAGRITGLVGPNGSGKTTLFNIIYGLYKPDGGRIYFQEQPVENLPPHKIYEQGLAFSFQLPRLFFNLTVLDNLIFAARQQTGARLKEAIFSRRWWQKEEAELAEKAYHILELLEMAHMALAPAGELSGGQRKLVEVGRALMSDPSLVLLDEPAAGVNPVLGRKIYQNIAKLCARGISFLIIEHKLDILLDFANYIYLLDKGSVVISGEPREVIRQPVFYTVYVGEKSLDGSPGSQ